MALHLLPFLQQWLSPFHPLALFLAVASSVFILVRLNRSRKTNLPPSPLKLPIIGNLHQLGTTMHRSFREHSQKYGPIMLFHMGYVPTLVVSSAEIANEIIKSYDIVFANRPSMTAASILLYNCKDMVSASYGEYWRHVKKICVTELLSIKRVQAFKFVRQEEIELMVENISRSCSKGASINLTEMLLALSNNIVSRCALGRKHGGRNRFGELSREFLELLGTFTFRDLFPLLGWIDVLTGLIGRMKKVSRELDTFFDQIINEHLIQRKNDDADRTKDFVDLLLDAQENNIHDIKFTRENIKALILDMFVAGTDTTSTTIEWAVSELVKNPHTMKKAQEEVRRVVGNKSKVDEDDIPQMDYLKCVVKETLRLHPPLPLLLPRQTAVETNVKGYHIPAKTTVFINVWAIQRDSKSWDRAEEFIPERFINNTIDFKGHDFGYIPFGSGRRGCPGMFFGLAMFEFVIANLLYWFDWELPGGAKKEELDMSDVSGITINRKVPLHLVPISHFP